MIAFDRLFVANDCTCLFEWAARFFAAIYDRDEFKNIWL
jgi:hypothetical protein